MIFTISYWLYYMFHPVWTIYYGQYNMDHILRVNSNLTVNSYILVQSVLRLHQECKRGKYAQFITCFILGIFDGVRWKSRYFFSPRMWHHAGRPTTAHCSETIGINVTSPQETDNCTLILDKQKFKASISPKNELDYPSY